MSAREVLFHIDNDDAVLAVKGRDAWALSELMSAGEKGCTPIDTPGPRWSAYVHNLRKAGVIIETHHEAHAGPFPGSHARYVLVSTISVVKDVADAA